MEDFYLSLPNEILTNLHIEQALFKKNTILNKEEYMFIQFKIKTSDN